MQTPTAKQPQQAHICDTAAELPIQTFSIINQTCPPHECTVVMGGKVMLRGHGAAGSGAVHEKCAVEVCLGLTNKQRPQSPTH